ncbi:MAG: hypothetical protein A2806_03650 [Candidatus Terrybacteria bacterium RIFCSPHIGHO2_01_FULL_48_17]|uniref:Uncharacterized protein n=1 Tax=Candidatus Terrybacteria bacterium RIFCSPHIGHO2_01_FULL_48_17 TaxID=1802362 RepID=A0A1G2PHD3_9BACT|nr:MAG: hypothetical protein A2806_03650 [Candidatus Terrybacteria bacterium RIFCSPHIGHO2_01_FULL_48_17]OHA53084.1 MAG: hypothetical protein A3A30_01810 [Candidatus Terrybacteria bacterium RIFCSPLOWO2_01_FULL_48_14]
MLTVSVQAGERSHQVTFQRAVGNACGSRFCNPCRAERGLEVEKFVRVRKVEEDENASPKTRRG